MLTPNLASSGRATLNYRQGQFLETTGDRITARRLLLPVLDRVLSLFLPDMIGLSGLLCWWPCCPLPKPSGFGNGQKRGPESRPENRVISSISTWGEWRSWCDLRFALGGHARPGGSPTRPVLFSTCRL